MTANYAQLIRTRDDAARDLREKQEAFQARPHAFTEGHKRLAIARAEQWLRICQSMITEYEAAQAEYDAKREDMSK